VLSEKGGGYLFESKIREVSVELKNKEGVSVIYE